MSEGTGREKVAPARLYALLTQAFEQSRNPSCQRCAMPLPVFRSPPDPQSANWHTGSPRYCAFGCHVVVGEVQSQLWGRYDMLPFETPPSHDRADPAQ